MTDKEIQTRYGIISQYQKCIYITDRALSRTESTEIVHNKQKKTEIPQNKHQPEQQLISVSVSMSVIAVVPKNKDSNLKLRLKSRRIQKSPSAAVLVHTKVSANLCPQV